MLNLNEKLGEVQLLRLQATFHALPRLYLRTYARKKYATLEINSNGANLRPDYLDWIVRYEIAFFHCTLQCEQVVGP